MTRSAIIRVLTRVSVAIALCTTIAACAVGPDFVQPNPPAIKQYNNGFDPGRTVTAQQVAQRFTAGQKVPSDWWRLFSSEKLTTLVQDALAGSPGLEADEARLRESQDTLLSGYGVFYPAVDAGGGASRQQYSPLKVGQTLKPSIFNLFTLSATVSYTLDIFGGERRTIEGLGAQVELQNHVALATSITLSSNIVNTVIARAAYKDEIDSTQELFAIEKEQVRLAQVQVEAGTASYAAVLSLQSQLASLASTLPQLEQQMDHADNVLAALSGKTPAEWKAPEIAFGDISLPGELPVSLPSDLVRQRPDILEAEATLHGASAAIGVATAAMLPSVTLTGGYGDNASSAASLFSKDGNFWSIGANIAEPIFDGGTLWFKRKAAMDAYQASLADYRQTVLNAFAQVADVLRALDHDAAVLSQRDQAMVTAEQALHLIQANYDAGLVNYDSVLLADQQFHQAKIADIEAVAARYQDTVALYVALGGGWWKNNAQTVSAAANP